MIKRKRNRLFALLAAVVMILLSTTAALALSDNPDPTEPTATVSEEPTKTPEPTEPTTKEPTTKHTHVYGEWKTIRPATTKKDGLRQRICDCGKVQKKTFERIASIELKYKERVYNGKAQKNAVLIRNTAGKALKNGRDFVFKCSANKNVGKAVVTIKGKGNYKFNVQRTFRILPQSTALTRVLPTATKATVQWTPVKKQCSGYYLQYATDSQFKKNAVVRKVKDAKKSSIVLTGLKAKTTYYIRIRTFCLVKDASFKSAWSNTKKCSTVALSQHGIDGQVPKSKRVSASWFDDAVFVGDSVSLGLSYYEASADVLGKAQFLTAGSLGSGNALQRVTSRSVHPRYKGTKMKVEKGVAACGAKKVFIMLGMNDIGVYGIDKSVENFRTLCKKILAEAPGVKIYVESVTPRANQGAKSDKAKLNNKNITAYNQKLAALCAKENWFFVNVAEFMFDGTGHLKRAYCSDPNGMGMHFSYVGCKAWVDYLYTHTA